MNVIRVRKTYAPTAKFTTWLYTLAHNRIIDHWRANGHVHLVSVDDDESQSTRAAVDALPAARGDEPAVRAANRELSGGSPARLGMRANLLRQAK